MQLTAIGYWKQFAEPGCQGDEVGADLQLSDEVCFKELSSLGLVLTPLIWYSDPWMFGSVPIT